MPAKRLSAPRKATYAKGRKAQVNFAAALRAVIRAKKG